MKANEGQQSPKLQISLLLSSFNAKSSINVNVILKECVFKKSENFHFHYINFLKSHFVEYVKFSKHFLLKIMVLVASVVSILHGKCANSSTSFHQWKYY
jgi:DNA-dependent RNA polymerase auxiliary subunit epsilon